MTLLAAVFHLCSAVNQGHVDTACRTRDIVVVASTIRLEARRYNIDPFLVAALIQRESAYDPGARSSIGALGLMQILRHTAATRGYEDKTDAELMAPRINIRLGVKHLALWRRFCKGPDMHGALSTYSGRGRCRPSTYSRAIIGHARDVKGKDLS